MKVIWPVLFALCILRTVSSAPFELPEGFSVQHFANDDLAHDIWCLTIDKEDRICVGGPGYIKFLIDTDNDGIADKAETFTDQVRVGPMGLLIDETGILSVEKDAVVRYTDKDGDLKADGEPEVLVEFTGKGGEHGPHGIRKGPDGCYYVVCGNNTGVDDSHANMPGTPITDPNQGCIIRINPYGLGNEIIAHGFRNPYDIAFSDDGRLFTYDSDNERDHHLPWYAPTRVFDVAFGRHHGWLNPGHKQSYNAPEYYTIDRLAETGRGSPTGIEYYWHDSFPEKYHNGLFFACWTFGRIYHTPLEWLDDSGLLQERQLRRQTPEVFAKAGAEGGFAPVDLAIDSLGNLWVACGGRNTSGHVYRISPNNPATEKKHRSLSMPQMMVGRQQLKPQIQHPQTVREFLPDSKDLHLVYQAYQNVFNGINHRPEPRTIDAGYTFSILPDKDAQKLRETITIESGSKMLLDMDQKAEQALQQDTEAFAEYWLQPREFLDIEPWRNRNYRELARTLAGAKVEYPPTLENISTALLEDTHPTDDLHYLFCLAQMPGQRTSITTWRIASAFLRIDAKLAAIPGAHPSRNWPRRLKDLFTVHCELDRNLAKDVMWSHSLFGNNIHHARFVEVIKDPELKQQITEKMYLRIRDSEEDWTPTWISLLKNHHPDISTQDLRKVWDKQPRNHQALASLFLPKADVFDDNSRLFQALGLANHKMVSLAAEKLSIREPDLSESQFALALSALARHQKHEACQSSLLKLLASENFDDAMAKAKLQYPDSVDIAKLFGTDSDLAERLPNIDWSSGNLEDGQKVFVKHTCNVCHSGQNRLGPSLKGAAARFGRDDFFRHTIYPNLAISDLYKAIQISTHDGKHYTGVPVYSSPDQTLLEVGPGKTINFSQSDILETKPVNQSPMPAGLLLTASDKDLADLWAYIRSIPN